MKKRQITELQSEVRAKAERMDDGDLEQWLEDIRYEREKLAIKCGEINQVLREREIEFLKRITEK